MSDTISKEDLERAIAEITDKFGDAPTGLYGGLIAHNFCGVPIIENPHVPDLEPVIQLSEILDVSPEFRKKCNDWYIDMFGYKEPVFWRTDFGMLLGPQMNKMMFGDTTA